MHETGQRARRRAPSYVIKFGIGHPPSRRSSTKNQKEPKHLPPNSSPTHYASHIDEIEGRRRARDDNRRQARLRTSSINVQQGKIVRRAQEDPRPRDQNRESSTIRLLATHSHFFNNYVAMVNMRPRCRVLRSSGEGAICRVKIVMKHPDFPAKQDSTIPRTNTTRAASASSPTSKGRKSNTIVEQAIRFSSPQPPGGRALRS